MLYKVKNITREIEVKYSNDTEQIFKLIQKLFKITSQETL